MTQEQTQPEQGAREADPLVRTVTFDFAQRIAKLFESECPVTVVEAKGEHAVVRLGDEEWGYEYTISVRKSA